MTAVGRFTAIWRRFRTVGSDFSPGDATTVLASALTSRWSHSLFYFSLNGDTQAGSHPTKGGSGCWAGPGHGPAASPAPSALHARSV